VLWVLRVSTSQIKGWIAIGHCRMGGKVIKGSRKVLEWAGLPSPAPLLAQAWVPRSHFPPKERAINL